MTKPRKCKICKAPFVQFSTLHTVCSPRCGLELALRNIAKREASHKRILRAELKEARERLKTKSDHVKELDTIFSKYIRLRDRLKPCICCGEPLGMNASGGNYDAGHYVSRSHMATRWDEANVHAQRKHCNRYLGGNPIGFEEGIIQRLGEPEVVRLKALRHTTVNYSIPAIQELIVYYKLRCKEMT